MAPAPELGGALAALAWRPGDAKALGCALGLHHAAGGRQVSLLESSV